MAPGTPQRAVNPQLGIYFGIFVSAMIAVAMLALMLEQLGVGDGLVRLLLLAAPVAFFAAFAGSVTTTAPLEFFAAGRRIPPFFAGLVLATVSFGGIGVVCLPGVIFHAGVDGFAIAIGMLSGLVLMGMLLTPFLRKAGAFTAPGFLARRLDSRIVRITAATVLIIPVLLLCVAEVRVAGMLASRLTGLPVAVAAVMTVMLAALLVVGGGVRSMTWAGAAKGLLALIAITVPVMVISVLLSSLPLPHLVQGNIVRLVSRQEIVRSVPAVFADPLFMDLPGVGLEPVAKQFLQSFGSIGPLAFLLLSFTIAAGMAGMPSILQITGPATGVHASRKSVGWAVLIVGFAIATAASVAAFLRHLLLEQVVGLPAERWPPWIAELIQSGFANIADKSRPALLTAISVDRDMVMFAIPTAAGLPGVVVDLMMVGAFAACLAAACAALVAAGSILSEDVVTGLIGDAPPDAVRVVTARLGIVAAAIAVAVMATFSGDPLQIALSALSISSAAGFPVLVLAVFWKRLTPLGAAAAMIAGFGIATSCLILAAAGVTVLSLPLAGVLGMIAAFTAGAVVTPMTPAASRTAHEFLRDMRVPGGETILDRRARLERLRRIADE